MSTVAKLQQELAAKEDDLNTCNTMLAIDPNDADALELKAFTSDLIADLKAQIAAKSSHQSSTTTAASSPPPPPKFDMSKHPKFRQESPATPPAPLEDTRVVFSTGDSVLAKYSGDKAWYQATIISKTGSSADPVYTVAFVGYGDKETKRKHEVRAMENKKRKAEGPIATTGAAAASTPTPNATFTSGPSPAAASNPTIPPPPPPSTGIISAAPSVDPSIIQKREPSKVSDGPSRMAPEPKRLKGNKALDKAKSSWNDWQKNGPKKSPGGMGKKFGKDSQFRTPDLPNAKVGFTGSGKPMQKDPARAKWEYGQNDADADYD